MDVFKEQIVRRVPGTREFLIKASLVAAVVIIAFVSMTLAGSFFVIITAAAGFGAYYLMSFYNLEYEYVFTNGELDIDVIYAKSRRKRVLSVNVKDLELMAHVSLTEHANTFLGAQQVKDCGAGKPGPDTYAFLMSLNGKQTRVIFDPNEKMLKAIASSMNRRKLHLRPGVILV